MTQPDNCRQPLLPPLITTECRRNRRISTTAGFVYDPRQTSDGYDVKPLRIHLQHGRRKYDVTLKPNSVGAREEISMRHLAEAVHELTKVKPQEQRFLYKGVSWESSSQTIGQFSPLLRDLGIKDGDKILLVSWPVPMSDYHSVETLKALDNEMKLLDKDKQSLIRQLEEMHYLYGVCGARPTSVSSLRQQFLHLREQYMMLVQRANSLTFDHRNVVSQTSRRQLMDDCQRQMDRCFTAASHLFDRLVLSVRDESRYKNRLPQMGGQ